MIREERPRDLGLLSLKKGWLQVDVTEDPCACRVVIMERESGSCCGPQWEGAQTMGRN